MPLSNEVFSQRVIKELDKLSRRVDDAFANIIPSRKILLANRSYYVTTVGSDTNDGQSWVKAFRTIQKAIDTVAALDIGGYTVTIEVAAGTYTTPIILKNVGGFGSSGNLIIIGNTATPSSTIISTTSATCITADGIQSIWDIKGFRLQTTTSGNGIQATNGSNVRFSNLDFGVCANNHMSCSFGATITQIGIYSISGGCGRHVNCYNARIITRNYTITLLANVTMTHFAYVQSMGFFGADGTAYSLGAFAVTAIRYYAEVNSAIYTNGGGATFLPGNVAGSVATGAQYV